MGNNTIGDWNLQKFLESMHIQDVTWLPYSVIFLLAWTTPAKMTLRARLNHHRKDRKDKVLAEIRSRQFCWQAQNEILSFFISTHREETSPYGYKIAG